MGSGSSTQAKTSSRRPANFDLYISSISPNCRCILLACEELGIQPNLKEMSLIKQEHINPAFVAINPYHCVPTLTEGPLALWESRAILAYIVNEYGGPNNPLYPSDNKKRAVVDMILYHSATVINVKFGAWLGPLFRKLKTPEESLDTLKEYKESLKNLQDNFLKDKKFMASDNLTIADFSLAATIVTHELMGENIEDLPKLNAWLNRIRMLPYYEKVNKSFNEFKSSFHNSAN